MGLTVPMRDIGLRLLRAVEHEPKQVSKAEQAHRQYKPTGDVQHLGRFSTRRGIRRLGLAHV